MFHLIEENFNVISAEIALEKRTFLNDYLRK